VRRVRLSNKEIKGLVGSLGKAGELIKDADAVEVMEIEGGRVIYIADLRPVLLKIQAANFGEVFLPTLYLIHKTPLGQKALSTYPLVLVDAGAVKHILNGADVMRPGVRSIEGEFERGSPVLIADEKRRVIAVGVALYPRGEVEAMDRGKVIHNAHYLGDKIWKLSLELAEK
jgi:PUA domain protein